MAYVIDGDRLANMITTNGTNYVDRICIYTFEESGSGIAWDLLGSVKTIVYDGDGDSTTDYVFSLDAGDIVKGVVLFDSTKGIAIGLDNTDAGDEIIRIPFTTPYTFTNAGTLTISSLHISLS